MIKRTYNNMLKATKMIVSKGYEWNEANEMAMKCFDYSKESKMSVEFYIAKFIDKET